MLLLYLKSKRFSTFSVEETEPWYEILSRRESVIFSVLDIRPCHKIQTQFCV
jgi:hypothetical protein